MMETDNPFEKVLDRLREKGWIKGASGWDKGPNCIAGAVIRIVNRKHIYTLDRLAEEQYPDRINPGDNRLRRVAQFNDHPDTTFADVERVLEKAAVKWEEERVLRDENM